jgi:hypothetical protein
MRPLGFNHSFIHSKEIEGDRDIATNDNPTQSLLTPTLEASQRTTMRPTTFQLLLLFFASCCQAAYIVTVPAKDEECFLVSTPKSPGTLFGNFDHLDSGLKSDPISVVLIDTGNDRILHRSRRGTSEGNFKINLAVGQRAKLCIQNGLWTTGRRTTPQTKPHDGKDRTVGLQFTVELRDANVELVTQNMKNVESALGLTRELEKLRNHHDYMRVREAMHRETVERTFSQLLKWSLLEGFMVVLVAAAQIMYFRRFLERRRYM